MDKVLNPNLPIPIGLDSLTYSEMDDSDPAYTQDMEDAYVNPAGGEQGAQYGLPTDDGAGAADVLYPPTAMTIVEQTLYFAEDGSAAVDVIIEVEDSPNLVQYDIRVAQENSGIGQSIV